MMMKLHRHLKILINGMREKNKIIVKVWSKDLMAILQIIKQ